MPTPSLSIVIPVYNEPDWIGRVVAEAATAQARSPFADAELVIVDDGSDARTREALGRLKVPLTLRVIRQENAGRFAARRTGIEAARGDIVLLLDSRVSLDPDALAFVGSKLRNGDLPAWNGHVEIEVEGNPFARFWNVVSHAAFREYLREPRTTSFGLEEYDRFPKGTTCFLASREALLSAIGEFRSLYSRDTDLRHVNDDTVLLRSLAERQRINISPGFACVYRSRTSLPRFLAHAFHRGTVFFDGFARPGTRYAAVIVAFFPSSVVAAVLVVRRPRLLLVATVAAPLAAAAGAGALRRPWRDVVAVAALAPPFLVVFAAGLWRGAAIALRARSRA